MAQYMPGQVMPCAPPVVPGLPAMIQHPLQPPPPPPIAPHPAALLPPDKETLGFISYLRGNTNMKSGRVARVITLNTENPATSIFSKDETYTLQKLLDDVNSKIENVRATKAGHVSGCAGVAADTGASK